MASRKLKLFVGNIPWTVTKKELSEYFSNFGALSSATVLFNNKTGLNKGYGFIGFKTSEGYNAAVSQDTHVLENSKLLLSSGKPRVAGKRSQQQEPRDEF